MCTSQWDETIKEGAFVLTYSIVCLFDLGFGLFGCLKYLQFRIDQKFGNLKLYVFINGMSPLLAQCYSPKPNFVFLVVVLTCIFLSYFAGSASRTKCDAGFGKSQR